MPDGYHYTGPHNPAAMEHMAGVRAYRREAEARGDCLPPRRSEADRYRYRAALEKIAGADLKRTSAGWLQQVAQEAIK